MSEEESLGLEIAGVRLRVIAPPGVRVYEPLPQYQSFLSPDPAPVRTTDEELTVRLELGSMPEHEHLPLFFRAADAWTAHRDGDSVVLAWRPVQERGRLWLARLELEARQVTVYCGAHFVEEGSGGAELRSPLYYPLDQLIFDFFLARRGGLLLHAAGLAREGRGAAFAGRSGAGKTTLMRGLDRRTKLLRLSDDRVIVREIDGRFWLYGTPWAGEGQVAANRSSALGALVFLHKGDREELQPVSVEVALRELLPASSVLWFDSSLAEASLGLCDRLLESTPAYDLHFRREVETLDWLDELF